MHRRWMALGVVVAGLTACQSAGSAGRPSPHASQANLPALTTAAAASPSPASKGPLLFAVLEARGPGSRFAPDSEPGVDSAYDTVAIVGLSGYASARATFTPRPVPFVGEAAPILGLPAQAVAGAVYYVDGHGAVWRLTTTGSDTEIADFPMRSQQEERLAVSPDGSEVVVSRLTLPPEVAAAGGPPEFAAGVSAQLQLLKASRGQLSPTTISTQNLGQSVTSATVVAGWDDSGPLVLSGAVLGTQAQTDSEPLIGRHLQRLDPQSGTATAMVGGSDCAPWSELANGTTLCWGSSLQVRSQSGSVLWTPAMPKLDTPSGFALSPDAQHVAVTNFGAYSDVRVLGADGSSVELRQHFVPEGWLDDSTLIGYNGLAPTGSLAGSDLAIVRLANPGAVEDLGFRGAFVGVVQP